MARKTGEYQTVSTVGGESCRAFVPRPLPPKPALNLDSQMHDLEDKALLSLGRLDSVSTLLPDTSLFLYMYIRKEAVLSSQIEGTQSSLSDLLLFESESAPGVPLNDVQEVSNYVAAINHGITRLSEGMPLSNRLIREIHGVLLSKGRGNDKDPGEFRRSQNWIGGSRPGNARYVPPPPERVPDCMGALEKFFHNDPVRTPILLKAALSHVQFESIHPFLDGNGRLGRLLITLLLCSEKALSVPLLYLSLYFKTHRDEYYRLLQNVRDTGDWEGWVRFFLNGVRETSEQAVQTARNLVKLFEEDREKLQSLRKAAGSAMRVHHELRKSPIITVTSMAEKTGLTFPTVKTAMERMRKLGIVTALSRSGRSQYYSYGQYIAILSQGTEPL